MNEQETAAQLQAAFTRLIEGEAEPHDESLIAEHLKSHPESIALLRKQLEVDALLQLEADSGLAHHAAVRARNQPMVRYSRGPASHSDH